MNTKPLIIQVNICQNKSLEEHENCEHFSRGLNSCLWKNTDRRLPEDMCKIGYEVVNG